MSGISLGGSFGINNVIVPRNGPKCIPAQLDFTAISQVEIDGEQVVSSGKIEFLQGVFVDNSLNANALSFTMGLTGQKIIVPSLSQGYFSILASNPPHIVAETPPAAGLKINVLFYNVPIQSQTWKVA